MRLSRRGRAEDGFGSGTEGAAHGLQRLAGRGSVNGKREAANPAPSSDVLVARLAWAWAGVRVGAGLRPCVGNRAARPIL